MRMARGPVFCKPRDIGTPRQIIKIKRGGVGHSNQGPCGRKLRPSKVLARAMAEQARRQRRANKKTS